MEEKTVQKGKIGERYYTLPNRIPYMTLHQVLEENKGVSIVPAIITRFDIACDFYMFGAMEIIIELTKCPENGERVTPKYELWRRRNHARHFGIFLRSLMELFLNVWKDDEGWVHSLLYPSDMLGKKACLVINRRTNTPIGIGNPETDLFFMQSEIAKWARENTLDDCSGDAENPLKYLDRETIENLRERIAKAKEEENRKARMQMEMERQKENEDNKRLWTSENWDNPEHKA